jgi:hypothetical protein
VVLARTWHQLKDKINVMTAKSKEQGKNAVEYCVLPSDIKSVAGQLSIYGLFCSTSYLDDKH